MNAALLQASAGAGKLAQHQHQTTQDRQLATQFKRYEEQLFQIQCDIGRSKKAIDSELSTVLLFEAMYGRDGSKSVRQVLIEDRTASIRGWDDLEGALEHLGITASGVEEAGNEKYTIRQVKDAFPECAHHTHLVTLRAFGIENGTIYFGPRHGPIKLAYYKYPGSPIAMSARAKELFFEDYLKWYGEFLKRHPQKDPILKKTGLTAEEIRNIAELQYRSQLYPLGQRYD